MAGLSDYELRTMPGIWKWREQSGQQLAFSASSPEEAARWQTALRTQVWRLLGSFPTEYPDPQPALVETSEMPEFLCELMVIQTLPGEYLPFYVLTPHQAAKPLTPVIALHGHGTWGAKTLVGIENSPAEAEVIASLHADYARKLVIAGYQVFVPMLRGFAERMEDRELDALRSTPEPPPWLSSCHQVGLNAILCGQTLMGLRVWDVMRLIDYIHTRADVQADQLSCVGLSGGGTLAMYLAGLDLRIKRAYISGAINTFKQSLMSIDHCVCNYVPNILQYAEMADVAGLIAPRPLMVESGSLDPIYPQTGVTEALATLKTIYEVLGKSELLTTHTFVGQHRFDGEPLIDWMQQ